MDLVLRMKKLKQLVIDAVAKAKEASPAVYQAPNAEDADFFWRTC